MKTGSPCTTAHRCFAVFTPETTACPLQTPERAETFVRDAARIRKVTPRPALTEALTEALTWRQEGDARPQA